jgi:cell division protein FtsL
MSDEKTANPNLSKSDTAFFIRAVYDSLIIPDWNRGDVIDLGTNIVKKVPLASFSDKLLGRLLPSLTLAAEGLHDRMTTWLAEQHRLLIGEHEQVMSERDKLARDYADLSKRHQEAKAQFDKLFLDFKAYQKSHPDHPTVEQIVGPPDTALTPQETVAPGNVEVVDQPIIP